MEDGLDKKNDIETKAVSSLKLMGWAVLQIVLQPASRGPRPVVPSLFRDVTLSMFCTVGAPNSVICCGLLLTTVT